MTRLTLGAAWARVLVVLGVLALGSGLLAPFQPVASAGASEGSEFTGMWPTRVADSRTGTGMLYGPIRAGTVVQVPITHPDIPADSRALALNVTVTKPQTSGYATVFPCGQAIPKASNLNFAANQTIANSVFTGLGSNRAVCIFTSATAQFVVDVNGYFPAGSAYRSTTPVRMADTRVGTGVKRGLVPAGGVLKVPIAGRSGVPALQTAVLNVTVTGPQSGGYVSVFPCGEPVPKTSNLNFTPGLTVPNMVASATDANGAVCFYTSAATHLVVDLNGYYPSAGGWEFVAWTPVRAADTRTGDRVRQGMLTAGRTLEVPINREVGVDGEGTVLLNVTVTQPQSGGHVSVFPCGQSPLTSTINFSRGQTIPNTVAVRHGLNRSICVRTTATTHVIVDLQGWFPPTRVVQPPPGNVSALDVIGATDTSVSLRWTNPEITWEVVVRRSVGSIPPASPTAGVPVPVESSRAISVTDTGLTAGVYSYSVWAVWDGRYSLDPATITVAVGHPAEGA